MHPSIHLLLAAGLLFPGAPFQAEDDQPTVETSVLVGGQGGQGANGGAKTPVVGNQAGSKLGPGKGLGVGGANGNFGKQNPNDKAINALLFNEHALIKGGSNVFGGEDAIIRAGPFEIILPGEPSIVTSPDLLLVTLTDTASGNDETIIVELPPTLVRGDKVPMLVAFHKCCNTQFDISANTTFPAEARARGWLLMAPLGAFKPNFSSLASQSNTEEALDFVLNRFSSYIDLDRIYGVGFSMGGGSALSFAARHLDPAKPMFAALVNHTGGLDLINTYENEGTGIRDILEFLFRGTPGAKPFNYQRSSLVVKSGGPNGFDPDVSMAWNLTHIPILDVRAQFDEPATAYLLDQNTLFETAMSLFGGIVTVDIKPGVSVHNWSTLPESQALDFLEQFTLELPTSAHTLADRDDRFFYFDIVQDAPDAFSPFTWSIRRGANEIRFSETANMSEIHFDPFEVKLDPSQTLVVWTDTTDGIADTIVLEGFPFQPVEVLRDGLATTAWSHDISTSTLSLNETDGSANHIWHVTSRQAASDVGVSIFIDEANPTEGDTVDLTVVARNFGPSITSGVEVASLLPTGLTYVGSSVDVGTYEAGTGVWELGLLEAPQIATLVIQATVDVGTGGQMLLGSAAMSGLTQVDLNSANDSDSVALTVSNDADLVLTKTVDNDRPKEGEQIVYTLSVTNLAPGAQVSTLTISDSLPAGVTYVSDVASLGSYSDGTGIWTIGTFDSGATATLDITVAVDVATIAQTIVNNASVLTFDQNDPNLTNNADSASILVVDDVDFSVGIVVDDATPNEQDQVVYTITVTNGSGSIAGSGIELTDLLPAGVSYVSDVPSQGSYSSISGLWQVGGLGAGANATLAITAQVDVGTGGQAIVNSTTALSADQPDPNASNDSDSVQIDVDDNADLSVTKVVDDATPIEQAQVVYTITVANPSGGAQATGVSLVDLLPAGVTYFSDTPSQGSYVSGTGVWTVGVIDAGNDATLDITATVDVGSAGMAIVNTASGLLSDQPDSNASNDSDTAQIDVSDLADLSVSKVVDVGFPEVSDSVVYTITISNPLGGAQATNLSLTDLLPSGVTYVSDTPSQGSYVSGTGVWTIGSLASGAVATLDITASVDPGTVGMTIANTVAGLTLDQTDPNASNDTDMASFLVVADVDLSITKTVDDATPSELGTVVYTITVANTSGTVAASNVSLVDLLPSGVTFVSDNPSQGSYVDGTGVWTVGSIAASSNATLDLTATVDAATGGTMIVNTANSLAADQPDANAANNSDSVQIDVDNGADLAVSKIVDDATPEVGDTVVYTVTVSNPGGGAQATTVSVTDLLPSGVTYVSDSPSQGTYVNGTGVWTVGTINAGANATLGITVTVDAGQAGNLITNTTTALSLDQADGNATNDVGTIGINVVPDIDLSVVKTVDDATPNEQDTIVYTITLTNNDASEGATTITLTDVLPAGVTYVSDVASQGTYVNGTGVWTVGTVAALGVATLDITVTVDVGTGGDAIVNTTSALGFDQTDTNAANDVGSVQIDVDNGADLAVSKIVDVATPEVGDTVVYTVTVSNPGGGAQATTVSVTDLLPSGVTYVSDSPSQGSYVNGTGVWTVGTINAGANATLGITVTVDAGQAGNLITNTTTALSLDQTDSNATNDVGTIGINVVPDIDLSVVKTVDDATPNEQDTIVYSITLTNNDASEGATTITLTDVLPAGVTYVSDVASQGTYVNGTGVWTVGTVAALGSATLDITATVDVGTGGDAIVNTTSALSFDQTDTNAANDVGSVQIDVDNGADLAVSKIVDVATPEVGDTVVYTVTVSNPGGGAQATTVSVTDLLPSGVTYVSDSPSQGTYVNGTGVWTVGTINAGANATLGITVTVDAGQAGNLITNTTTALSLDQTDGNATNDVGTIGINVVPDIDLSVVKTVDDATPNEQDTIVYTITLTNNDASEGATTITLTDVLPAGVTYVSDVASQGSYVNGTGVWTVGTVAALGMATLDITVTVDVGTGGDAIVNTTSALSFDQTDTNAANDVGSVQIDVDNGADLAVSKIVDDPTPEVGDTVVYTVTVSNPGGGAQATTVSVTDLLPSGVTYISDSPSQGTYVNGTGVWTVGTVNAGANATLGITVTVDAGQAGNLITNTTTALSLDQTDSNATNDVGTIGINVVPDIDLSVVKTVDDATPNEQDTVVYTITLTNNDSSESATTITVTDVLPAGVTYVSNNPSQGSFASGTGIWTVGTVAALGSATLGITVTVDVGTGGDAIVNTTSALGFDQTDTNAANDVGSVQIDVDNGADLAVSKVVDDSTPDELQSIVYTITVSNPSGGAQATTVSLTDALPAGVTYSSDTPSQGSFASGSGVWTVGTINAGSNATLAITVSVDSGTSATMITNSTSGLSLDQTDGNSANDIGSVTVTVN